jgi:uncharacterized transporter YbjL
MTWIHHVSTSAPEIFLFLAVALGTLLGRIRIRGFAIGATACTVDAAVTGSCEVAESQTPVLGVAVPYAIANVVLTVLGPIIVGLTFVG